MANCYRRQFQLLIPLVLRMARASGWIVVLAVLVAHLACVLPVTSQNVCSPEESQALLLLKESISMNITTLALQSYYAFNFSSWQKGSDCCSGWEGIECDMSRGVVTGITIKFHPVFGMIHSAAGSLAPSVCDLKNLRKLVLTFQIQGQIPNCVWRMGQLQVLSLTGLSSGAASRLSFEDPKSVKIEAQSLQSLNLTFVGLTGALPDWFGDFKNLASMVLSYNEITSLPQSLANLTQLQYLSLSSNKLVHLPRFLTVDPISVNVSPPSSTYEVNTSDILPHLRTLLLDHNEIKFFSPYALPHLNVLQLNVNNISSISLDHMTELMVLNLAENYLKLEGISVSSTGLPAMLDMDLSYNNLRTFPEFLISCPRLQALDLGYNWISTDSRKVSELIGSLPGLMKLSLDSNKLENFSFELSDSSLNSSRLLYLSLKSNNIRSFSLGNVSSLQYLFLEANELASLDFDQLGRQVDLQRLSLSDNNFTGEIPLALGRLQKLWHLDLSYNGFSKKIPDVLRNLTRLQVLGLYNNQLTGQIPDFLSNLTLSNMPVTSPVEEDKIVIDDSAVFMIIDLSNNHLTGDLPHMFFNPGSGNSTGQSYIYIVDISSNLLTGDISWESLLRLDNSKLVEHLFDFSYNLITGDLSALGSSGGMENLSMHGVKSFSMTHNQLHGSLEIAPLCSSMHEMLTGLYLNVAGNNLTGSLPDVPENCSLPIKGLVLTDNSFQGVIPESLGNLGALQMLSLDGNEFYGKIPPSLGNCSFLNWLILSDNHLSGTLPPELQQLSPSLQVFQVDGNSLEGEFPSWISSFGELQVFDISRNNFEGEISDGIDFSGLRRYIADIEYPWLTDYNKMKEVLTAMYPPFIFTLSRNGNYDINLKVKGSINLFKVSSDRTFFGIANNRFSGSFPVQLGLLRKVKYLDLSGNRFSGSIPGSIVRNLTVLESLELSNNQLSGSIPESLTELTSLAFLNVSYNQLTGRIPVGGQISTFNASLFEGNADLCGVPLPAQCLPSSNTSDSAESQGLTLSEGSSAFTTFFSEWISFAAICTGFGVGFAGITLYFWLSGKLRDLSLLLKPQKPMLSSAYNKPYGLWVAPQ